MEEILMKLQEIESKVGQVIVGLLYLWVRDSGRPLDGKLLEYVQEHFLALIHSEIQFSNEEILAFLGDCLASIKFQEDQNVISEWQSVEKSIMRKRHTLQRRDHCEYSEGPSKQKPLYAVVCDGCGHSFETADPKARKCSQCLWKELSWC